MELTRPDRAEERRYAAILEIGTRVALVVMVLGFALYLAGWLPAAVAPAQLEQWWSRPAAQLPLRSAAAGAATGSIWSALAAGDLAALVGIALLASCSVPALLALWPLLRARGGRGDRTLAFLVLAEVLVIAAAASGLMTGGHR